MNDLLNHLQGQWAFALGLVIGFPVLLVLLSELGFALARKGHPVAASVRLIRAWVVPFAAIMLFLRWVLLLPGTSIWVRLAATSCGATAIFAIMGLVNNLVFEAAGRGTWQAKVPRLLRDLLRLVPTARRSNPHAPHTGVECPLPFHSHRGFSPVISMPLT